MQIKIKIVSFLVLLCFSTCVYNDVSLFCEVTSIDDLDWLKEELEADNFFEGSTIADGFVYHAYYQDSEVVYVDLCCPACNVVAPEIRTCEGETLGRLGTDINIDLLKHRKVIWRSRNGVCR